MNLQWIGSYRRHCLISLALWVPISLALASDPTLPADEWMAQGVAAFQRGQFEQAARAWQQASDLYANEGNLAQQFEALVQLADAYQALGQPGNALSVLALAKTLAEQTGNSAQSAAVMGGLGKAYWLAGALDKARTYLEISIALARQVGDSRNTAVSLNNLGNLLSTQAQYPAARAHYEESLALARQSRDQALVAKGLTNLSSAALQEKDYHEAEAWLQKARQQTQALQASHDKAFGLIALGQLYLTLPTAKARWHALAYRLFNEAATLAETLNDQRTLAYAWGYLGQLYREEHRDPEAVQLTRQAVFAAQQAQAPDILYRWQWQLGRLLTKQGNVDGAILAYRQAVTSLQAIRHALLLNSADRHLSFQEAVGDAFFELADLLLQRASQVLDPRQQERYLLEARDTVEQLKTAEVKDYYQDDCVTALQSRITSLDRLSPRAAALYPIVLPDRIELLLSLAEGLKQVKAPPGANRKTLTQTVEEFRRFLEKRTTREYLPSAQRLYSWLIGPIKAELQAHQIDTLIIVPDGPLRTVPLAALHDGKQFLIDRYAVATTPGLTLTDLRPLRQQDSRLLLTGLTKSVQGFPALQYVSQELNAIHQSYGGTVLKDEDFRLATLQQELTSTPYSIVHIASHGQFASVVDNTFLLTFDGKLTMDRLERFMALSQYRTRPVELLTLSACQTAAGDERAALGLAGIAIKAGARSAVATLWFTHDQASALLISAFYHQLQTPGLSKAKALQRAQLELLADRRYEHPGYWSPFLLIGNWL